MKKILCIALSLLMLAGLVACQEPVEITRGTVDGNVFTSTFSGITFTKPDSWVYSSADELAQMMNSTIEEMTDSKFAESVSKLQTVQDMMVTDKKTGCNVSISYENLLISGSTKITAEEYLEKSKQEMAKLSETMGITATFKDSSTKTLGGDEYVYARFETVAQGITMSQHYYLRKVEGYMTVIVATLVSGYEPADIEAMFS